MSSTRYSWSAQYGINSKTVVKFHVFHYMTTLHYRYISIKIFHFSWIRHENCAWCYIKTIWTLEIVLSPSKLVSTSLSALSKSSISTRDALTCRTFNWQVSKDRSLSFWEFITHSRTIPELILLPTLFLF